MKRALIIILLFFLNTTYAETTVDKAPSYAPIVGTGQLSCGQFIQYKEQNYQPQLEIIVQWVWGFLSAYNFRGNFNEKWQRVTPISSLPDSPTVLLFLETYCRKNPANRVFDGTLRLIETLHGTVALRKQ